MPDLPVAEARRAALDTDTILDGIRRWVEVETPTDAPDQVNMLMDMVQGEVQALGCRTHRIPGVEGFGDHVAAASPWGDDATPGILVLSHLDTVHPLGTIGDRLPYRVEGDRAYGPGIYDMKGGAYLAFHAFTTLLRTGETTPLPIRFLFTSDEEVGSPTSRAPIEAAARAAKYVLVTEPGRDGDCVVTGRKGVCMFNMTIDGVPSHAGGRHQDGRSALVELARQILDLEAMTDYAAGLTVNVGTASGGTRRNVVPAHARALIDMRFPTLAVGEPAVARVLDRTPHDPNCTVAMTGGINRPPFERTPAVVDLYGRARALAAEIGFDLGETQSGGGSDGNFTAPIAPTLDGLGVLGGGAHTYEEHAEIPSLAPRAELFLRLFRTLT